MWYFCFLAITHIVSTIQLQFCLVLNANIFAIDRQLICDFHFAMKFPEIRIGIYHKNKNRLFNNKLDMGIEWSLETDYIQMSKHRVISMRNRLEWSTLNDAWWNVSLLIHKKHLNIMQNFACPVRYKKRIEIWKSIEHFVHDYNSLQEKNKTGRKLKRENQ